MKVGDSVIVTEKTFCGKVFKWNATVLEVGKGYYRTEHKRNVIQAPECANPKYTHALTTIYETHYHGRNN